MKKGYHATVLAFLDLDLDPKTQDERGRTALFDSIKYNHRKAVETLLQNGAEPHNLTCFDKQEYQLALLNSEVDRAGRIPARIKDAHKNGETLALNLAVKMKNPTIVARLLKHGADPNRQDHLSEGSLTKACRSTVEILSIILEAGCSLTGKNANGCAPLNQIALEAPPDWLEKIKLLTQCGIDANSKVNLTPPIHLAVLQQHDLIAKFLLDIDADVHAFPSSGYPSLVIAAVHGKIDAMKMLIKAGARIDDEDAFGCTGSSGGADFPLYRLM